MYYPHGETLAIRIVLAHGFVEALLGVLYEPESTEFFQRTGFCRETHVHKVLQYAPSVLLVICDGVVLRV